MITIPGYVVVEPLGRGRTGAVYRVEREEDGARFAARKLADPLAAKAGVAARLLELRDLCTPLRSPVAVPVDEVIEWEDQVFVLEPFIDGEPLARTLGDEPMEEEAFRSLAMDLLDGLADLHRQRIVHGDIRPSNVLLSSGGPRLVGAGVALRTGRRAAGGGGFLLRDPYDAPELDSGTSSHLTDVFAVGALLLYAVTGEEGPYHFLSHTDGVRDVLLKATSAEPADRQPNVEALRAELIEGLANRGRLRLRDTTGGPVITSWGPAPAPSLEDTAPVAWPEEDEVQTREGVASITDDALSARLSGFQADARAPESPPNLRVEGTAGAYSASPRSGVPDLTPSQVPGDKWHVVDLDEDEDEDEDAPELAKARPGATISARKEGRELSDSPAARLLDAVKANRKPAAIGAGVLGGLLLVLLVWDPIPDGMAAVELDGPVPVGNPEGQRDEQPGATVAIPPFALDRTEVTVGDYRRCMETTRCAPPEAPLAADDRLPVTGVTWIQAQTYCRTLGKRLPSENEWEAAARRSGRYPWGDEPPSCGLAHYGRFPGEECAEPGVTAATRPVPEEPDDFVDLAGNVWEFVDADYAPRRGPGTGDISPPGQSTLRVLKGGAYSTGPGALHPGARIGVRTDFWAEDVGFRCAAER